MPTAYIEKLAKEGKGSVAELEKKWDKAKAAAKKEGKDDNFAYITSIFQKIVNAHNFTASHMQENVRGKFPIKASARIQELSSHQEDQAPR